MPGVDTLVTRNEVILEENPKASAIITEISSISVSPTGLHFAITDKSIGKIFVYDRQGRLIDFLIPHLDLTDSVVRNHRTPDNLNLILRKDWYHKGKSVADDVQAKNLKSEYRNAVFISDTILVILAEVLTVDQRPDSMKSLIGLPTLVQYNIFSRKITTVCPIDFVLDSVTPLCQFLSYDYHAKELFLGTAHPGIQMSSTLKKVVVPTATRVSLTGHRLGDHLPLPPEHNVPGLRFNVYTMSFATSNLSESYAVFNTIPRVYNVMTGTFFNLQNIEDNEEFFYHAHQDSDPSRLASLVQLFRLDVKHIAMGNGDTLYVSMWSKSPENTNQWNIQKYSTEGRLFQTAMIPSSENKIRYVGYSPELNGVIIVRMSQDEKWRLSIGTF